MAEYFTARGLPVPRELRQNPLTDWRRLTLIAAALIVFVIGLRVTNLDLSRANPEYSAQLLRQLFQWDLTTGRETRQAHWNAPGYDVFALSLDGKTLATLSRSAKLV